MIRPLRYAVLGVLAVPGLAQTPTDTVPTGFLTQEGDARHWIPGHFAPARAQTTYDSSVVALPTGNISHLWLRADSGSTPGAMQAHRLVVTLHMGSRGVPAASHVLPESYSRNHGTDHTRVLDRAPVDFPAFTPNGSVAPWHVSLPIQPFPFVAGNNLQLEWDIEDPSGSSASYPWFLDADDVTMREGGGWFRRTRERDACPSSGTIYDGEVGGPGDLCSVWFYSLSPPNLPAVTWFGTSDTTWDGTPLPIDLTPIGFAGCSIQTDLRVGIAGQTDSRGGTGRFRIDVPIPFDQNLAGTECYTQTFVLDTSFGGGLRASDRGKVHIGNFVERLDAKHLYSYRMPPIDWPEYATDIAPIIGVR